MSHSQFHSTNLFILRHAWLNLWDKHMTTGRINQVTTFQMHHKMQHHVLAIQWLLSTMGVRYKASKPRWLFSSQLMAAFRVNRTRTLIESVKETPYSPDLTYFRQALPVCKSAQRSPSSERTTSKPAKQPCGSSIVAAYPRVINCNNWFSHRQTIHINLQR